MATLSQADSKRMYSWWWDSHISPKNSKWLQENLTDMDANVKAMIKLINEDADSFARRAEMYYKKRPELMKLVEEFYRAYRALAERYNHATGVIRQAHQTMAEAFPNQVPLILDDSVSEADPRTPEMSHIRTLLDHDALQNDAIGLTSHRSHANKRNGELKPESDSSTSGNGLKQINDLFGSGNHEKFTGGRVRKALNFQELEGNQQGALRNENDGLQYAAISESAEVQKAKNEVSRLKEALTKLEAEKEAGLLQYQQCLVRLSKLESEVSRAQEDSKGLGDQASKAEAEVQSLLGSLHKVEAENEANLLQYRQSLDRITELQNIISHAQEDTSELNQRVRKAESDTEALNEEFSKVKTERDTALDQYTQSLDMISNLENRLGHAEEDAKRFSERAVNAEEEVEALKLAMEKLNEEKEASALQYQKCLETISNLETKLSHAQEEAQRLNIEIDREVEKLKGAEEHCLLLENSNQSLRLEVESLALKIGSQSQELTENQNELGRLWTCIQEERMRFMEAETAFQALQQLHSKAQEELGSLAAELQNRTELLRDMEARNQSLHDELSKIKEENNNLIDLNLSSAMSMKEMQTEILGLKETKGQLEQEVDLRLDQRNALQQEIYCLKEELNGLNEKHHFVIEQLDSVGLNPNCVKSSVKEMQEQMSNLNEVFAKEKSEKEALLIKLEVLQQLQEKNTLLENSLSDLSAELEALRGKIKGLEESYLHILVEKSTLLDEKSALTSQLQAANENLEEISAKNMNLEKSLSNVHDDLQGLKTKSKCLEESRQVLVDQNHILLSENSSLSSQLDAAQQGLNELGKIYKELQDMYLSLNKEKESTLHKVEELQISLDAKRQHALLCETRLAAMESQMHVLLEEDRHRKMEFEKELDKALGSQIESFILQRCIQDVEEDNNFLLIERQRFLQESKSSESLISKLEKNNFEKQMEVKSLCEQSNTMKMGLLQLLNALDIVLEYQSDGKMATDKAHLDLLLDKVVKTKASLCLSEEENQQLTVEMSILVMFLDQLIIRAKNLEKEKYLLNQEFMIRTKQFSAMQGEVIKVLEANEDLKFKLRDRDNKLEVLTTKVENLQGELLDFQKLHHNLQKENSEVLEERRSLLDEFLLLKESNVTTERENLAIYGESLILGNLSLIFRNYIDEKSCELKELREDFNELQGVNYGLCQRLSSVESRLAEVQVENLALKEALVMLDDELKSVATDRDQLTHDVDNEKNMVHLKDMELLEVEHKLSNTEIQKLVLHEAINDVKREYDEVKMIKDGQEKEIVKLSEEVDCLRKQNVCLHEGNQILYIELHQLKEENEKTRIREQALCSELQKEKDETDMWKAQASVSFGELQVATICQVLFQEKVSELSMSCKCIEEESTAKDADIELIKERIRVLEGVSEDSKSRFAAYGSAVNSLKDNVSSLESKICLHRLQISNSNTVDVKHPLHMHENHPSGDQNTMVCDTFSELEDLQTRIRTIENVIVEMEQLAVEDNLNLQCKLEAAMKQIEELKSENSCRGIYVKTTETESELMTKDIMLDQISECSSYGKSRRQHSEAELWENYDQDDSIGLAVGKAKKIVTVRSRRETDYRNIESTKKSKRQWPTSDVLIEKDFGADKLETSKRSMEGPQEGSNRKVLERLNSDIQKLSNLQTTVLDLKRKLERAERNKKGKATLEFGTLKEQLLEVEETILKLFNQNEKLMENVGDGSFSGTKPAMESEENDSVRRRRVSGKARRVSEKIGRLQLEVQKIQFVLLKLHDDIETEETRKIPETKRRVLLRDYLYGGVRRSHKQNKAACCACIRPPKTVD